jgi:molecular chaperone DnaK (HSP70)
MNFRNVVIYDFGGGTFDVSVLEISRGEINVLGVGGDNHLGGDDIDTNLINYCLEKFEGNSRVKVVGAEAVAAMCRLRKQCEEHKKRLSEYETTEIIINNFYQGHDLKVTLTRDQFEKLNEEIFKKSIDLVKATLDESKMKPKDINDIVLVGGTTRIQKVRQMLSQFFGGRQLNHDVDPDEAVANGAAIQAALLNGQQSLGLTNVKLLDVNSHSLGIEVIGGIMSVIIPRNTPVPTHRTQDYFTTKDNQTYILFQVFEGENQMTADNQKLGEFKLEGIPSKPKGVEPVAVTFKLTA